VLRIHIAELLVPNSFARKGKSRVELYAIRNVKMAPLDSALSAGVSALLPPKNVALFASVRTIFAASTSLRR